LALKRLAVIILVSLFCVAFSHQDTPPWESAPEPSALELDHPWYENGRSIKRGAIEVSKALGPQNKSGLILKGGDALIGLAYRATEAIEDYEAKRVPTVQLVRISSRFGMRVHPVLKRRKFHNGVDFAAPRGTPVRAVADGVVTFAGWSGGAGKMVKIKHDGFESGYAHLASITRDVRVGQRIEAGETIGGVGATGLATGNHLHFTIRKKGRFVDPMKDGLERIEPMVELEIIAGLERNVGKLFTALENSAASFFDGEELNLSELELDEFWDDSFL
jgi:murein DD-endopeptidase MepM/ murein hydrolase activator NlpD